MKNNTLEVVLKVEKQLMQPLVALRGDIEVLLIATNTTKGTAKKRATTVPMNTMLKRPTNP